MSDAIRDAMSHPLRTNILPMVDDARRRVGRSVWQ
jgi:hypothetical protein